MFFTDDYNIILKSYQHNLIRYNYLVSAYADNIWIIQSKEPTLTFCGMLFMIL